MPGHDIEEKRQFQRFLHREPVEFQFKDPNLYGGCLSADLSAGGMRVRHMGFIPLNIELSLQIQLGKERIFSCTGRVVWVEKARFGDRYQAGVAFTNDKSLEFIQRKIFGLFPSNQNIGIN